MLGAAVEGRGVFPLRVARSTQSRPGMARRIRVPAAPGYMPGPRWLIPAHAAPDGVPGNVSRPTWGRARWARRQRARRCSPPICHRARVVRLHRAGANTLVPYRPKAEGTTERSRRGRTTQADEAREGQRAAPRSTARWMVSPAGASAEREARENHGASGDALGLRDSLERLCIDTKSHR